LRNAHFQIINKGYSVGSIELNTKSNSSQTANMNSNFTKNEGNALVYLYLNADHNDLLMTNIKAYNNTGHSNSSCRGGFLVLDVDVMDYKVTYTWDITATLTVVVVFTSVVH